jgi:hypothetical protein
VNHTPTVTTHAYLFFRILALVQRSHRSTDFHVQWLIRRDSV